MWDDLELLRIDLETTFVLSRTGRLERQNDPGGSTAPNLLFIGCPQGNLIRVRHDVDEPMAEQLLAISATEPPWRDPWVLPGCIGKLLDVFSNNPPFATGPASRVPLQVGSGIIYELPNQTKFEHAATIVRGDSDEGTRMLARFAADGMSQPMIDSGFISVADLWEPWCIATDGDQIAAIASAARLGKGGAEIGVYTFPEFRARGFAAAVTAGWSSLAVLDGRALFYSTSRTNRSSQRVAARLGLRMIGASFTIA